MIRLFLAACLLVSAALADEVTLDLARDNSDALAQAYIDSHGQDGALHISVNGRRIATRFKRLQPETLLRRGPAKFDEIAEFREVASGKPRHARIEFDLSQSLWKVSKLEWISPAEARAAIIAAKSAAARQSSDEAARVAVVKERRRKAQGSLLDVELPKIDGTGNVWLAGCPAAKCLTVYLTPWCPYCEKSAPAIRQLRAYLKVRGIPTRIVVGDDSLQELRRYGEAFGPETLLDLDKSVQAQGVPHFFVSADDGTVLNHISGWIPEDSLEDNAARIGIP